LLAMVRLLAVLQRTRELVDLMAWAHVMRRPLNSCASSAFWFPDFLLVRGVVAVDQVLERGFPLFPLLIHCVVDGEALITAAAHL
jgi:hypothetical protein